MNNMHSSTSLKNPTKRSSWFRSTVFAFLFIWTFLLISYTNYSSTIIHQQLLQHQQLLHTTSYQHPPLLHNNKKKRTLHVLNSIHLNDKSEPFIIDEWEINLKSVLTNAPPDSNLHIHMLSNKNATQVIDKRIRKRMKLLGSKWRNQVSLTLYNVESKIDTWRAFINSHLQGQSIDERVSIGGYFRLLAHEVLKERGVDEVIYMDTDVVILSNLNDLMKSMNTTHVANENMLWQYAATVANSGFMVVNINKLHRVWELISKLPRINDGAGGDQTLLAAIVDEWPNEKYNGVIPEEWNIHLGHGFRGTPHRLYNLVKKGQNVGMLHFTGGYGDTYFDGEGIDKYCGRIRHGPKCKGHEDKYRAVWGLAEYYIRLPWELVTYFGSSQIPIDTDGYPFQFELVNI